MNGFGRFAHKQAGVWLKIAFSLVFSGMLGDYGLAFAQLDVLQPIFKNISGGVVWGSNGYPLCDGNTPQDRRARIRGGFAALYGPLHLFSTGHIEATSVFDSVIVEQDSTTQGKRTTIVTRKTSFHKSSKEHSFKDKAQDKEITLVFGYEYADSYSFTSNEPAFRTRIPVEGIYIGAFMEVKRYQTKRPGPAEKDLGPIIKNIFVGVSAGLFSFSDISGSVGDIPVSFSAKRSIDPEFYIGFTTKYNIFFDLSYQLFKVYNIRYEAASAERPIPEATLRSLPETIRLNTVHLTAGIRFSADGLF